MNNCDDKQINQNIQSEARKKNGVPLIIRVLAAIVALVVLCEGVMMLCGRDIVILLSGSKNYFGFVESQSVSSELSSISKQLFQLNSYNTVDISSMVSLNDIDSINGYKESKQSGIVSFLTGLTHGSTLDLKLGKNAAAKSFIAGYGATSASGAALSINGYLSRDRLFFNFPQLTENSLYINSGSLPQLQPFFDLAGSEFDSGANANHALLDKALNKYISTAFNVIKNNNVSINRNKTVKLATKTITADEITVKISQQELNMILKNIIIGAASSDNFLYYTATANSIVGYIDNIAPDGATMKILVKNSLFNQQVLSQQITIGSYGISLYELDQKGGFTIDTPKSKMTGTYSVFNNLITGMGSTVTSDAANATKFSFTLNKNAADFLGFDTGSARVYQTVGNKRFIIDASLSKNGAKSDLEISAQNDGITCYKAAFSIGASADVISVPAFNRSNSIDLLSLSSLSVLSDLFHRHI
jgi:hypothetical protein